MENRFTLYRGSKEEGIILESLKVFVEVTKGDFICAFNLLPLSSSSIGGVNDWAMSLKVIAQLLSGHMKNRVDGIDRVLSDKEWIDNAHACAIGANGVYNMMKHHKWSLRLTGNELFSIITSLDFICKTRLGRLEVILDELPYDYNNLYNHEDLSDWTITRETIGNIVRKFTISNVSYFSSLSPSHPFFVENASETLTLLDTLIKVRGGGGEAVLLSPNVC